MARKASHSLGTGLTKTELVFGWLYLPFYLVLLSVLLNWISGYLKLGLSPLVINVLYFCINAAVVPIIFHRFLRQRFFGEGFWDFIQALILGFVMYYAGDWVIRFAVTKFGGTLNVYNDNTVNGLILDNPYIMFVITVIAAPIIEETLIRGLVFGSIRPASRVMAYITSILVFTLMHNWQYFGANPLGSVLLSCLPYIPASAALAWTYEKSGTIWGSITLHAVINAISFGVLTLP